MKTESARRQYTILTYVLVYTSTLAGNSNNVSMKQTMEISCKGCWELETVLCASDVASASLTHADPLKNIKAQKMRPFSSLNLPASYPNTLYLRQRPRIKLPTLLAGPFNVQWKSGL